MSRRAGETMHYLITGQGKTGTTALFASVRQALPASTHCNFEPRRPEQIASVFDVAGAVDTVSKVKLRYLLTASFDSSRFDRTVMLVRDPRDRLVSQLLYGFYDFQVSDDRIGFDRAYALLQGKVENPESIGFYELAAALAELRGQPNTLGHRAERAPIRFSREHQPFVAKYEDFVDGELDALDAWLGLRLVRNVDVGDTHRRVERSRSYGEWRHWFTDADLVRMNADWARYFEVFGYPEVARSEPDKRIPVATSLGYAARFRPA
jgi:hypothetical protein